MAVVSRVPGVLLVNDILLAEGTLDPAQQIGMRGLELPRIAGISVSMGDPIPLDQVRGQGAANQAGSGGTGQPTFTPVPVVPEECA